jgi:hypothetical protein
MSSQFSGHPPEANCQESGALCIPIILHQRQLHSEKNKKPLTPDRERSDQPDP